jgi:hypothetical protein
MWNESLIFLKLMNKDKIFIIQTFKLEKYRSGSYSNNDFG